MPWPAAHNFRAVDLSVFNVKATWKNGIPSVKDEDQIDFDLFKQKSPSVKAIITRIAGTESGADPTFQHNFDRGLMAGFDVAAYLNSWPAKTLTEMFGIWDQVLGGRKPKMIWADVETTGGKSPDFIRGYTRECLLALEEKYSFAEIGVYTADWFWRPNIGFTPWASEYPLWVAHYLYENVSAKELYRDFGKFEQTLPYSQLTVPILPPGWTKAVGWQFTSQGKVPGLIDETVDLNLFDPVWWDSVYRPPEPPEPEPPDHADRLREIAAELEQIASELGDA